MEKKAANRSEGITFDPQRILHLLESVTQIATVINTKKVRYAKKLEKILQIILDHLNVETGSIMVVERKQLVVLAATKTQLIGLKRSINDLDSVSSLVARTGKLEFIKDISRDKRFKPKASKLVKYKTKSLLSVPIKQEESVIGVINVTDKLGQKDLLQDDVSYLLNFSGLVLSLVLQEKLHDELKKQKSILHKRNMELHRREQLQGELSRMLIHDLKGPLSEVVANLDILSYTIADENREFLELAQIACDRTVRMASNLGIVAKMEDGKLAPIKEEVDPQNLLEEALISIKGLAKIKNITLAMADSKNLPTIMLDRVLILRVFQNLLTNALGYSQPGTSITIGCDEHPAKKHLVFYVQDRGSGLTAVEQETIFNKYARISVKQDTLVGTGLGLYFCKLALEVHKGEIKVQSAKGQGSRFYFTIPL